MKKVILCTMLCLLILCGCYSGSGGHDDAYDEGYWDGHDDAEYSLGYHVEELRSLQTAIAELMYAHEYEVVKKLSEYSPRGVGTALEIEFGVEDIDAIIDYLQELSETVIGNCEYCGYPVFADEFAFLPIGIECAHNECITENDSDESYWIKKDN